MSESINTLKHFRLPVDSHGYVTYILEDTFDLVTIEWSNLLIIHL
jgi:hypothetical protein